MIRAAQIDDGTDGGQKGLIALVTLGTTGVMTFLAMPVIAAALVNKMGATERDVGLFSTTQLITLAVGCLLSTFLPRGRYRRHGVAALAVMTICDLACLFQPSWNLFLVMRAIGGVAGGVAVSQATAAMSETRNPERSFGFFLALQTVMSVVCVYGLPPIIEAFGFDAAYGLMLVADVVTLGLALLWLRSRGTEAAHAVMLGNSAADWLRSGGVLLSILCFFIGIGVMWTFLALLGQGIGLAAPQIALILSMSKMVAFGASFVPGAVGSRFGRLLPILVCLAILLAAIQLFAIGRDFTVFAIATAIFSFGWYTLYPFMLGALGQVDKDGGPMLAAGALTGAGLGIGPALTVLGPGGPAGIYLIASIAFIASGIVAVVTLIRTPAAHTPMPESL